MRPIRRWAAAFILLLSIYAVLFAFGPVEPSPRSVLPIVFFIVSFAVYVAHAFLEEKRSAGKQIGTTAQQLPRQDTFDLPIVTDSAPSREPESPRPPETILNRAPDDSSRATGPNAELPKSPSPRAPVDKPEAAIDQNPPEPRANQPATITAPSEPLHPQRETDPALVTERIRVILEQLDHVSAFPELIPAIESLFDRLPEANRDTLPKRPRTLAEHLFIARLFAKSGLSEEEFCGRTIKGTPEEERTYSDPVAVATLQDAKRELRWLKDFPREVDASHPRQ